MDKHSVIRDGIMQELDGERDSVMSDAVHTRMLELIVERIGLEGQGGGGERLEWEGKMGGLKGVFGEIHGRGDAQRGVRGL